MENNTQWQKRVNVFRYIYSTLINESNQRDIKDHAYEKYDFDANQLAIIEYYSENKEEIIETIKKYLNENWDWERVLPVDQAILIATYCESKTNQIDKKILIDQAIISAKHYSDEKSCKFINGILDKIL
jgi:N utilization substance protein B